MDFKMAHASLVLIVFFTYGAFTFGLKPTTNQNDYPIIGIVSQDMSFFEEFYPGMYGSLISGSTVKFIESAGARVIPILIGQSEAYYEKITSKINGVLFPGTPVYPDPNNDHPNAEIHSKILTNPTNEGFFVQEKIYNIAKKINDNNNYFPIWGICAGFLRMPMFETNRTDYAVPCSSMSQPLPLEFAKDIKQSRMFKDMPDDIKKIMKEENVTLNLHTNCITDESLAKINVLDKFHILSYSYDDYNAKFISAFEHVKYPFYGVQFHPEMNSFEWVKGKNIPHSYNAIKASRYFADFFVNEARKNLQKFSSKRKEDKVLIYNHSPIFTGSIGLEYQQTYMFKKNH